MTMASTDFDVSDAGSICIVTPMTEAAQDWLDANVTNDETQYWGPGIVVEPRYLENLVNGIIGDGLTVS
jgi:hypothetical protein